ncbi:uncharacterized protein LOC134261822 [Saccostrea cucullata]|uniref:uncharacterized protein LOC134261822 n=1 Tax=Saccostrea cuccullata TaxID=36930 RepID=UPI002ED5B435
MNLLVSLLKKIILLSLSNFLYSCSKGIPICVGNYKNCCAFYKWSSETGQCEKCLPGYSGVNCSEPCPYPFYGDECQGKCDCDNYICDFSTGCIVGTSDDGSISFLSKVTEGGLTENFTVFETENSTDFPGRNSSSVNDSLLVLIEALGGVDLLFIFAHFFLYIHDRRNRTDINKIDTIINYHRTSNVYENVDIDIPSTSDL